MSFDTDTSDDRSRVLLIGMGVTTATALESLVERFDVVGLVRAFAPEADACDATVRDALARGVRVYPDTSLKAVRSHVSDLKPDCVVVSSYGRILPADLLAQSRFVNVHYAPLPQYRGRANVNWALINGEPCAGISIHTIVPGLDAGNLLFQQTIPIAETDTVADLYERLNAIQRDALGDAVARFLAGDEGLPQDERRATYGCTRIPEDGEIDWTASTTTIHRLVRALVAPFPGAFTYWQGSRLRIWRAAPFADAPRYDGRVPGRVVSFSKKEGFVDVLTGDGVLRLWEVQLDDQPPVAASAVISSVQHTLGLRTADLLARIEQLERRLAELTTLQATRALPVPNGH
jgi:methionyl-tRNA formyltransferase